MPKFLEKKLKSHAMHEKHEMEHESHYSPSIKGLSSKVKEPKMMKKRKKSFASALLKKD